MQIDRDGWVDCFRLPIRMAVWLLALVLMMLLAFVAHGATVLVEWQFPVDRVDGTPLTPADIEKTVVEHGTCGAVSIAVLHGTIEAPSPAIKTTFDRDPGTFCVRAKVVDTEGQSSDWSKTVQATIASGSPPSDPLVLKLTVLPADVPPPSLGWYVRANLSEPDRRAHPRKADGTLNTSRTTGYARVGDLCDCTDRADPPAVAGLWCSVGGELDARKGLPLPYPAEDGSGGAFTYCVERR